MTPRASLGGRKGPPIAPTPPQAPSLPSSQGPRCSYQDTAVAELVAAGEEPMAPLGPPFAPQGPALLPGGRGSIQGQSSPSPPGTSVHCRLRSRLTSHPAQPRRGVWGPPEAEGH